MMNLSHRHRVYCKQNNTEHLQLISSLIGLHKSVTPKQRKRMNKKANRLNKLIGF
jgi:hypothetical protein